MRQHFNNNIYMAGRQATSLVLIILIILVVSFAKTHGEIPSSLARVTNDEYFLKKISTSMCSRQSANQLLIDATTNHQYFLFASPFRQLLIDNFRQEYRINFEYKFNSQFKIYIFTIIFLFLIVLLAFATFLNKSKGKLLAHLRNQSQNKVWQLPIFIKYINFIYIVLIFLSIYGGSQRKNQLKLALERTICRILESEVTLNGGNILTVQGQEISAFHNDIMDYQLKFIDILEETQKNIRRKQIKHLKLAINQLQNISKNKDLNILSNLSFEQIQKCFTKISTVLKNQVELINFLRENLMLNRIKLINRIRQIDSIFPITKTPEFVGNIIQNILSSLGITSLFLLLSLWISTKTRSHKYMQMLLISLFIIGFITLLVFGVIILLSVVDFATSLVCSYKLDLQNPSTFKLYFFDKSGTYNQYMNKILGHTSGTLSEINQISLQKMFLECSSEIDSFKQYVESKQLVELDEKIKKQVISTQERNYLYVNTITNHTSIFQQLKFLSPRFSEFKTHLDTMKEQLQKSQTMKKYNLRSIGNYLDKIQNQVCSQNLKIINSLTSIFLFTNILNICFIIFIPFTFKYFKYRTRQALSQIQMSNISQTPEQTLTKQNL